MILGALAFCCTAQVNALSGDAQADTAAAAEGSNQDFLNPSATAEGLIKLDVVVTDNYFRDAGLRSQAQGLSPAGQWQATEDRKLQRVR
jgi:hypothetical protein